MKHLAASVSVFLGITAYAHAAVPAFDPAADCAAQPYGLSPGQTPGDDSNDMIPQISATDAPEFLPGDEFADLFLDAARPILHDQADLMMKAIDSACISKKNHTLYAAIYLKDLFSLQLKQGPVAKMETYRADFPRVLKLSVNKNKNFITVDLQGRLGNALQMFAAVPMFSDRIYLHRLVVNTDTQWMQIFAGTAGDRIGVVAWSHFDPKAPITAKLSLWQTMRHLFRPVPATN